jgi:uncharacterized membrane protein YcfT
MTILTVATSTRAGYLDKARGLAIVLMILDHSLIVFDHDNPLRYTVTRVSMPLFFLVSGHLVRRLSWRILAIGAIGLVLPLVVPWIDDPNVLLLYAVCAPVILLAKRYRALPIVVIFALAMAANHWTQGGGYWLFGVMGIMAMGALIERDSFRHFERLPNWVSVIGRYPLSIYVSHLLFIEWIFG